MKLYVGKIVNHGTLEIVSETTDEQNAKVNFHGTSQNLWNAPDVYTGTVAILDEQFDVYQDYKEFITHPEPEPEPEPEEA